MLRSFIDEMVQLRWRVLILIMTCTFGSYYIYDIPGSVGIGQEGTIQSAFEKHGKHYTNTMNQALYTVYNYPNIVLSIFGGILIDRVFGIRKATLLFNFLVFLGAALFWLGVELCNFPVMLTGRIIFSLGGESLTVSQSAFTSRWFSKSPALAVAFGICLSFSRVGSAFNFLLTPKLISHFNSVSYGIFSGVVACGLSLIATILLIFIDNKAESEGIVEPVVSDQENYGAKSMFTLPLSMWIMTLVCCTFYMAVFPFIGIAVPFLQVFYDISEEKASSISSVYQFACAAASPVLGFIVDRTGRGCVWMLLSSLALALTHASFLFRKILPVVMMILLGGVYSVFAAAIWPAVPLVVTPNMEGTAFGMMTGIQNLGSGTLPLIIGYILDKHTPVATSQSSDVHNLITLPDENHLLNSYHNDSGDTTHAPKMQTINNVLITDAQTLPSIKGFKMVVYIFIALAGTATIFSILLWIQDAWDTGIINATSAQRIEYLAERECFLN